VTPNIGSLRFGNKFVESKLNFANETDVLFSEFVHKGVISFGYWFLWAKMECLPAQYRDPDPLAAESSAWAQLRTLLAGLPVVPAIQLQPPFIEDRAKKLSDLLAQKVKDRHDTKFSRLSQALPLAPGRDVSDWLASITKLLASAGPSISSQSLAGSFFSSSAGRFALTAAVAKPTS